VQQKEFARQRTNLLKFNKKGSFNINFIKTICARERPMLACILTGYYVVLLCSKPKAVCCRAKKLGRKGSSSSSRGRAKNKTKERGNMEND
jgi:hypothetical protein